MCSIGAQLGALIWEVLKAVPGGALAEEGVEIGLVPNSFSAS